MDSLNNDSADNCVIVDKEEKVKQMTQTSTTTGSMISSSAMEQIVDRLKSQCRRDSTRLNYLNIWRSFNKFLMHLDKKPKSWERRIVLYVEYLIDQKCKSTTINSYISAIKAVLRDDGRKINEDRFLLNALVKACKLKVDRVKVKYLIHKGILLILIKTLDKVFGCQPYLCTLYKVMFATAYYGMFRVGEITAGSHPIKASDVHIAENKNKVMFILRSSKMHGEYAAPQIVKITEEK